MMTTATEETGILVNMIFARFKLLYGLKFRKQYDSDDEIDIAKREWALSLEGYSKEELSVAMESCKVLHKWPPTIADFIELIPGNNIEPPDIRKAYEEAARYSDTPQKHNWSHNAVYLAGKSIGWYDLRTSSKSKSWPLFRQAYKQACADSARNKGRPATEVIRLGYMS